MLTITHSPAMQAALDDIGRAHNNRRLLYLIRMRVERRRLVNSFMRAECYWNLLHWLAEPAPRSFLSVDEARRWLAKEQARILGLPRDDWKFKDNAHRLPGIRNRLVVARYFSRFGMELWAEDAA